MFLNGFEFRPWSSSKASVPPLRGYVLGPGGGSALQVLVGDWKTTPRQDELRALWKERKAGKAFPLLVVALYGNRAAICGVVGEDPPAHLDLDPGQVERLCEAALGEPDRHAAIRYLTSALPALAGRLAGLRNEGLFATHELEVGVPGRPDWPNASARSREIIRRRGRALIESLGYSIEPMHGPTWLLKSGGRNLALALFLDRGQSPDVSSSAFSEMSPVSYALARADEQRIPYVIIETGSALRIHLTSPAAGVGRRGRTDTYAEIQLDLLPDDRAGYLWLLFSARSLEDGGAFEQILESSGRFAGELGERLRDRIYADVVPGLAEALVRARRLKSPDAAELRETYEATLFLLFRVLFLAYAEDKDLLPYRTNGLYEKRSLKGIAKDLLDVRAKNTGFGGDPTLWGELAALFRAVRNGNSAWGVPAYNGALFSDDAKVSPLGAVLETIEMPDAALGPVLTALLIDETPEGPGCVDFRSLGVREFGTIYEGLLEQELSIAPCDLAVDKEEHYVPAASRDRVVVSTGRVYLHDASGTRKASGSYYTKSFAVDHLLERALDPALDEHLARLNKLDDRAAAEEFFRFYVADIAMGSGHFLVSAVDRSEAKLSKYLVGRHLPGVTDELARLRRTARENLGPLAEIHEIEDGQLLRRQIARRCIYGVDLNPIAVELARLSLWIHTFVPGLPLSFLDHGLVVGNSLVGVATFEEVRDVLGEETDQVELLSVSSETMLAQACEPLVRLARLSDATKAEIDAARKAWAQAREAVAPAEALLDIATAARLDEKLAVDVRKGFGIEGGLLKDLAALPASKLHRRAREMLAAIPPFHFPIAFPEVFLRERSGFDVIVGNPPWQEATVEEHAFWARHAPGLRGLAQREQEAEKARLRRARPDLVEAYEREVAAADALRRALTSGPYPGMGTGDPDLYKAFCWRFWQLVRDGGGRIGVVLPRSVLAAKGSTELRQEVFANADDVDITTILNNKQWFFEDVHPQYTIALVTLEKRHSDRTPIKLRGPYASLESYGQGILRDPARFCGDDVASWNDTASLPLLPTEESLEVFAELRKAPRLDLNDGKSWRARPYAELHATNDKHLMDVKSKERPKGFWPVYKGESFDLWQPDTGTYYAWADPKKVTEHLQEKRLHASGNRNSPFSEFDKRVIRDSKTLPCRKARVAFRDITNRTNQRTVIAALVPSAVFLTNKAPYLLWPRGDARDATYLLGVLCSLPLDWYSRRFVEVSLNFFILNPFPIPRPAPDDPLFLRAISLAGRLACPDDRFAEWAEEVGVECGPLDSDEKDDMIRELDAVVAHLYGLREKHLVHIFETFHEGWDYASRLEATLKHFRQWRKKATQ